MQKFCVGDLRFFTRETNIDESRLIDERLIRIRSDEARLRGVTNQELVWVYGPRRHDLAPIEIDDTVPRGGVVVRDLAGLAPTEIVRLVKVNTDRPMLPSSIV